MSYIRFIGELKLYTHPHWANSNFPRLLMPHYYLSAEQVMSTKRKRLEGSVTSELEDAVLEQSTNFFSPQYGDSENENCVRSKKRKSLSGIRDASQDATFVAVNVCALIFLRYHFFSSGLGERVAVQEFEVSIETFSPV